MSTIIAIFSPVSISQFKIESREISQNFVLMRREKFWSENTFWLPLAQHFLMSHTAVFRSLPFPTWTIQKPCLWTCSAIFFCHHYTTFSSLHFFCRFYFIYGFSWYYAAPFLIYIYDEIFAYYQKTQFQFFILYMY